MSLGHHPDRIHDRPGDPMDWQTHQAVHWGERQALENLGIRKDAFDRAWGNKNAENLPARRSYGNIQGKSY